MDDDSLTVQRLAAELESTVRELDGLRKAMATRASIEQAKGIVMGLHSCGEREAFTELVRMSQTTQTKLRDVAARLVAQVSEAGLPQDMTDQPTDIPRAG